MIYVPWARHLKVPYVDSPAGWVNTMTELAPVVWLRLNTATGTETNLGSGGGSVSIGAAVTRNASNGPVAGGGYYTTVASASTNVYIRSQVTTMWTTFTAGVWVKLPASGNSTGAVVISKKEYYASAYTTFPYGMEWDQTNTRLSISLDGGTDFSADQVIHTDNGSIPTGQWVLITNVVRPSGGAVEVYLNGSLIKSVTATTTVSTSSAIPVWAVAQANEYSGGVGNSDCAGDWSEFFVFNKALTATQIGRLYGSRLLP